jgi:tetratricopeptide (TPR) repeat protein
MGKGNSKPIGHANTVAKAEQASAHSKGATATEQINIRMVQNVLLIWLDQRIDDTNVDCQNTVRRLRRVVNSIYKYTNADECIQFLETIKNEKACMIVSGSLGQNIVPRVHNMPQVDSIFIFCSSKKYHEEWAKEWPKIKGVHTEITFICEALKKAAQQCEQDSMSISVMGTSGDVSKKNLDQLEPAFMYTQILKEILLTIQFKQTHFIEFIAYCREHLAENEEELKKVTKFEQEYRAETAIWWYSYDCFLYRMLNRAFWTMDADMIIKLGFFINDLHRQIEQLHRKQFGGYGSTASFTVYRGHRMVKTVFEKMSKGKLIAFNGFLSTSKKHNIAIRFAHDAPKKSEMVGLLFVMNIDPTQSTTPFASIANVSYFKDKEDEVLFSTQTVFRIGEITPIDGNDCRFQVELTLTSDNDQDLCKLTDYIRKETYPDDEGWYRLGLVLFKMGLSEKAEQIYAMLQEQTTAESEKGRNYDKLGLAKYHRGEYEEALKFYENALEIYKRTPSPTDLNLASCYNHIGNVYVSMGDYSKALSSHEKALEIQQQSRPLNHLDLGTSYNNIGNVYHKMGDYEKALSSHEKALEIQKRSLLSNHPDLGISYNDLGNVYRNMGDYPKALSNYEKALEIRENSLPPNHPDLCASYSNIGAICDKMDDYEKALSFHEKVLEIQQKSLSPNHPDLCASYSNIGAMYDKMDDYEKALSSHEKALEIRQNSLPPNHPDLCAFYSNIGNVYHKMEDYPKALSSHKKALEIRQQSLPSNHLDLGDSHNNLGLVYNNMGDYPKALSSHEKALEIRQQSLPSNHLDLGNSYNNLGLVYYNMGDYEKALLSHEKALEIRQSFSSDNSDLGTSYYNIGNVYHKMSDYEKALLSHEKALDIRQQSLPRNHPDLCASHNNIGEIYNKMGAYEEALSFHEKALEIQEQSLPSNHRDLGSSCSNIGLVYVSMGDYAKARRYYERAVNIGEQSFPSNHPRLDKWKRDFENIKEL